MVKKVSTIAIDGAVAVGKTTVGRLLARRLGYRFIDTGSMYRALTWKALKLKLDLEDEQGLGRLAATTRLEFSNQAVLIDGCDITPEIRTPKVEENVSLVSRVRGVREVMVDKQRMMAKSGEIVMAGRDIGTVVLPQAELKVYLVASPQERARRRYLEMLESGQEPSYDAILAELMRRDTLDSERAISPLKPAPDARIINTDGIGPEEVVAEILKMME